ncbi:MAG: hypothetical protein IPL46_17445 [Saprospiraceae bacterium]|nr:hypothetical protein [Saprospiraceae bacterium]
MSAENQGIKDLLGSLIEIDLNPIKPGICIRNAVVFDTNETLILWIGNWKNVLKDPQPCNGGFFYYYESKWPEHIK